jgi:hypothetical protein
LHLKEHLASQKFHEAEEVKNKVTMWLDAQVAFCEIIIKKQHILRLNKYLDKGVDYVEK